ncbi:endonuclease III [Candidatus Bathyarchaeota archaeon]|nr:endonuclease III [Candidatus Bathyarchaeota archaeon]
MPCSFAKIFRLIKAMNHPTEQPAGQSTLSEGLNHDPFKILITTILSQRTRDENTRRASAQLFSMYPDVESLANADEKTVKRLIRPSGFYHTKAKSVISIAQILLREYGGHVPSELDKLLELPSVGRKTANCVLAYGFRIPAIPVDTHVHRIANRLSIVKSREPRETERQLREKVKRNYWLDLNEEFVRFGQRVCRPVRPRCLVCTLKSCCNWYRTNCRVEGSFGVRGATRSGVQK